MRDLGDESANANFVLTIHDNMDQVWRRYRECGDKCEDDPTHVVREWQRQRLIVLKTVKKKKVLPVPVPVGAPIRPCYGAPTTDA